MIVFTADEYTVKEVVSKIQTNKLVEITKVPIKTMSLMMAGPFH
jgi:hypothetical protein